MPSAEPVDDTSPSNETVPPVLLVTLMVRALLVSVMLPLKSMLAVPPLTSKPTPVPLVPLIDALPGVLPKVTLPSILLSVAPASVARGARADRGIERRVHRAAAAPVMLTSRPVPVRSTLLIVRLPTVGAGECRSSCPRP